MRARKYWSSESFARFASSDSQSWTDRSCCCMARALAMTALPTAKRNPRTCDWLAICCKAAVSALKARSVAPASKQRTPTTKAQISLCIRMLRRHRVDACNLLTVFSACRGLRRSTRCGVVDRQRLVVGLGHRKGQSSSSVPRRPDARGQCGTGPQGCGALQLRDPELRILVCAHPIDSQRPVWSRSRSRLGLRMIGVGASVICGHAISARSRYTRMRFRKACGRSEAICINRPAPQRVTVSWRQCHLLSC